MPSILNLQMPQIVPGKNKLRMTGDEGRFEGERTTAKARVGWERF
jgi:hypothetical protein